MNQILPDIFVYSILTFAVGFVGLAMWNVLEIISCIVMIVIYGTAYQAVVLWEISVWTITRPFCLGRWILKCFFRGKRSEPL